MAAVRPLPLVRRIAGLGEASPGAAFTIRFATATAAAIWIGQLPGMVTNHSSWILITVLMLAQPVSGGAFFKGVLRAAGTGVAALVSILLFGWFSQSPPLLLLSFFAVQVVGAYGFSGPRYQYAWFVFAFTTAIILADAMTGGGDVETVAFQRATMVGIGVLIVFLTDSLLWPARAERKLRLGLAGRARQLAAELRAHASTPGEAAEGAPSPSPLAGQLALLGPARSEIGVSPHDAENLEHAALILEAVAARSRELLASRPAAPARGLEAVAAALEGASSALASNQNPEAMGGEIDAALREAGADAENRPLGDLVALVKTLEEVLTRLVSGSASGSATPSARRPERAHPGRLSLDPFRQHIALRAGIATSATLLSVLSLGWPMNSMVVPISFMIASVPTRGGVMKTALLVSATVLLGWLLADLAIVFFHTHVGELPLALLAPVLIASVLAWASTVNPAFETPRSVGTMLALLPVFGGGSAPTDVYGPYSTATYMALALGISWAATRLLWPATAATLFRQSAAGQLDLCSRVVAGLTRETDPDARRRLIGGSVARYAQQAARLGTLHAQAQAEPAERGLDASRRADLMARIGSLFDAVLGERGLPREFEEALQTRFRSAAEALRGGPLAESGLRTASEAMAVALPETRSRTVARQLELETWLANWREAEAHG